MTAKKRLLIADDSATIRNIVKSANYLYGDNYEIFEAENGKICTDKYLDLRPDLVISDFNMPQMNGLEALIAIRKLDKNARVIFLTSEDDHLKRDEAKANGALGWVLKPFNPVKFMEVVNTIISG